MKRTKSKQRQYLQLILWSVAVIFSLVTLVTVFAGVWYVHTTYEKYIDTALFKTDIGARSPRFYAYHFEDRENRRGEAVEVTSSVYAQKETLYVPYGEIPQDLINAFVAIEDRHFWDHRGVDWYRTIAACANYVLGFSDTFGASTITQQLVKNMTGEDQVTPQRKLREIFFATDLERKLDKSEIMELYLNIIHFSDQCDGIAAAAKHYYSKTPQELSVSECATITAITNNPAFYNPIRHPENNLKRRNLILSEMYAQGYLDSAQYQSAIETPLCLCVDESSGSEGINSWYTDMVIEDVIGDLCERYGMSRSAASHLLYTGGLRIDVAMDEKIQKIAERYYLTKIRLPEDENGTLAQSAVIILDNSTGDILGVAGAVGEKRGNHLQNFATQTVRSPGSTIKPLSVYAPALERGLLNWASVYDDVPIEFDFEGHRMWPQNASGTYRGLTNVAYAVAHSTNTVAVRVLKELGLRNSFDFVKNHFHFTQMIDYRGQSDCNLAALAMGQLHYGVTLREMTAAYTAFADGGVYHPYRSYYRVLDADGKILLANPDRGEVVLKRQTADLMTKLLQGVTATGTSGLINLDKLCECAGKTGTSSHDCDRWFIGYTPDYVCGVWSGYEYPQPLKGKNVSTVIWNDIMNEICQSGHIQKRFSVSSELVEASFCRDSGKLMTEACAKDARGTRTETGWFVRGTEPQEFCDCHVLCRYDTENGGVDHGFCPEEAVREVGLIRVERAFPENVRVLDAQYVYNGDPTVLFPQSDPSKPYFGAANGRWIGHSGVPLPYHRSCPMHQKRREGNEESSFQDPDGIAVPWGGGVPPEE